MTVTFLLLVRMVWHWPLHWLSALKILPWESSIPFPILPLAYYVTLGKSASVPMFTHLLNATYLSHKCVWTLTCFQDCFETLRWKAYSEGSFNNTAMWPENDFPTLCSCFPSFNSRLLLPGWEHCISNTAIKTPRKAREKMNALHCSVWAAQVKSWPWKHLCADTQLYSWRQSYWCQQDYSCE